MIRTSVMSSMEGRSIGYVNIFLFIVYFTYIIIGGVVFMWLEKPEEERVCSIENERYQNIARLQNLSLKIENEVDTSLLTDNDDSMTIQRALSIVDNGIGEMEYLTGQRRKRQAHWDTTWELRKLENITKNYDVDNYRVINEEMTYTEAVSRCEFLGDWAMTSTTSMDELIFLHHKVLAAQPLQLWLRLKETGATPCDTTCWAWKKTTFSKYNRHVSSWKRHPNFRYKNCHKQLPTICKRTKPKSPCEGNTCPKGSVCALDSRQDKGQPTDEKNLCVGTCPIGYAWGRPYANPGEETEYGCFDIDECEEGVHQCQEPFICLNRRGDYICSCPYQIYKRSNGELICQKQSLWGPVEEPAVDCDFTDSTNRNCNPDHRNKTTEEEEDIMALIKKHKIPVEEVSKSEKPRPAQINPYNSNAQKISEYFTQEEVASKYGNYSGIGKLSGEISYKATRQRGFPNFPTKLEFHTALKEGFVQDSVWHAAQRFFKDMPSYERSAASQLAKIEEFMISAEVTLWKMRKGHTTSRFVSENPENGANQIDAINKLFLKNETYGKSALLVGNAIINFEQGTIVTEVAMSKGHKPSRKQLQVVKHKSEESGDIEESIVIVDKDKADEIEGLKSEVRNASEVITNKTATIVVKTEQVHLTREELLQTRIALMAKYLIHIINSC
ncbi:Oidioi.mRNA.OKI2018_I69.XSR.g14002.t1.cds [Oikopleura dioica]|uniref:Oidioi.mRNA.OKI2018_I69.XSR.g14002.t1.cds n=1 Tax=Oikopleura dioica TaxID=34765 RepID=A0ABN7S932_OIKDI|nr:Oidioi.mRNA.OKI2018_I69.XSR.g14002.t1.cds [Oikopleura dioica]